MLPLHSLTMYKQKPAIVSSADADRIVIQTIDGDEKRVRQKDLCLIHPGPISSFPGADGAAAGDVRDALELLIGEHPEGFGPMSWREFAELAWSAPGPDHIVRAWRALSSEQSVELADEGIRLRSEEERRALAEKEQRRRELAELRDGFIDDFRQAWKHKTRYAGADDPRYRSFLDEIARYARGLSDDSPLARAIGIKMEHEAVHEALIAAKVWDEGFNPWPDRDACILNPPSVPVPSQERRELALARRDLRSMTSYAIDNEWSNDPDDAIAIEGDTVWIHVADPASLVEPGSDLDREAMERGSTLYLPERTIPMLSEAMVATLGLGLSEESPALSFGIRLDEDGRIASTTIVPSTVRVRRLTYLEADTLLDTDDTLQRLASVANLRARFRRSQGAIDIEFPEVSIKVRENNPSFLAVPPTRSANLVQELMILAGEAAARWAYGAGIPFPYSTQDPPSSPKAAGSGEGPSPSLARNYARRRSMRASIVSATCSAHAGLGLSFYSQVTSPLRRYQDLLAHYQIHAALSAAGAVSPLTAEALEERLYIYSQQAARNRQAERDSRAHWTMVHLQRNSLWRGKATVLDTGESGPVFIRELGYETVVRLPRDVTLDQEIAIALRRVSIAGLSASFDLDR